MKRRTFSLLLKPQRCIPTLMYIFPRCYHGIPFFQLYHRVTGKTIPESSLPKLKKKHPNLVTVNHEQLQNTLQVLQKFGITPLAACENPHLFSMNPISMDNYGEILKECRFTNIAPLHIIRYHTIVRRRTISQLKKEGLLEPDLKLEEVLHNCFQEWPEYQRTLNNFPETTTSILTIRVYVLEKYLKWRLSVTEEEFKKYCRNYLPLKHRPMCDIEAALNIAQNNIKFNDSSIRKNGFIISSDPVHTNLILENVSSLAGLDIREAIKSEPGILKNNYNSLLEIKKILEEFNINDESQRHCLRIYCMSPDTVRMRLIQLSDLKEYKVLFSNPRVLTMVVHKVKVMRRLEKIQEAKKHCYSLNHLVGSSYIFKSYISNFGNKACGRDIAKLISSSLDCSKINIDDACNTDPNKVNVDKSEFASMILSRLRKHKYWLHTALNVIDENIQYLKQYFDDSVIFNNCNILLYPTAEISNYINYLLQKRCSNKRITNVSNVDLDPIYSTLNYKLLSDSQLLSLVLYEIEKKHHFSGDGIWNKQLKMEAEELSQQVQQTSM